MIKTFYIICAIVLLIVSILFYTRSFYTKNIHIGKYKKLKNKKSFPIDVVVTYVDSTDSKWFAEKNYYLEKLGLQSIDNPDRWNDNLDVNQTEEIELCLLSILKNLPYIRKIRLVTHRPQYPQSLKTNPILKKAFKNDKIILVHHDMFMPKDILPVFNSNAIECHIQKIPNLSEQFIYFNDDMFVVKYIPRDKLFDDTGKPIIHANTLLHPVIFPICSKQNAFFCMKQRARNLEKLSGLWSLDDVHMFRSYTKSWYQGCIDKFTDELKGSHSFDSKFRSPEGILLAQLLIEFGLINGFAILGDNKDFPNIYLNCKRNNNNINIKKLLNENVAICINNCGGATRDSNIEKVFVELKNSFMQR